MDSTRKLKQLVNDTEELLHEIVHERSPELQDIRRRLSESINSAKSFLQSEQGSEHRDHHVKVRHVAASLNEYVRGYPWLALVTGVLLASTVGILATSATRRSLDH